MHEFPKWKILKLNFLKKTFLSFLNYCSIYYLYPTANCYFLHFPASLHGDTSYTLLKKEVYAGKNLPTFAILLEYENLNIFFSFYSSLFFPPGHECQHISEKIKLDEMKMKKIYIYMTDFKVSLWV